MKVKYRHFSEPDRVKIFDMDIAYRNSGPFGPPCREMSIEEYEKQQLEKMAKDKEKGVLLEFEVVDDVTAKKIMDQKVFDFYKNRLVAECGGHGAFRFNAIEYICSFPEIDPVEMAVALRKDGFVIMFDDSSISRGENVRKRKMVEKRFVEETRQGSVDGLIAEAESQKKEPVKNTSGRDVQER